MTKYIGKEMSRVDGVAKVTGKAKYAAEFKVPNLAYGFIVTSTIAKGTIKLIDTGEASRAPGVISILTHENYPKPAPPASTELKPEVNRNVPDKSFRALTSNQIFFNMQPIALVLAETFEQARYAARLVTVTYTPEKQMTEIASSLDKALVPNPERAAKPRGNPAEAFKSAPVKIEAEYTIPIEHHNPMEPHGAIAFWEGDKLTIFDKTQGVYVVRRHLATSFNIPEENVSVVSPFVGGAFGSSLRPNYYPALTAMAARVVKRPVKVIYTRQQMYTGHGYRSDTWQKVSLGAERNGNLRH
jgi:xanthine dehydrogenase YagR molybdenum-binding subunit